MCNPWAAQNNYCGLTPAAVPSWRLLFLTEQLSPAHHSATTKTSAPDNSYSLNAAQTSQNIGLSGYKANGDRPFQVASSDRRENGHKLSTSIRKKLFHCMGDETGEQIALEVLSLSLELFNTQLCMVLSNLIWVTLL